MKHQTQPSERARWLSTDVDKRGHAVLDDPLLNKGTAFTEDERKDFGLEGLLPHQVTDRRRQVERAYDHLRSKADDPLGAYVAMAALQDRNETLFYQVLAEHIDALLPIVYTPTVGEAAVGFSHLFRRGRGVWITPAHKGRIYEVLGNTDREDVRLIVVTDNERILGLGDQGAGGMVIPIGKLALYTLGAGIHPAHTLPISLDVGTDNEGLLADELYVGWPHPRLRGPEYDELVDEFVEAVRRRWPRALLQWEDFKKANAFRLLDRYRGRLASFNDDIQGTGAVAVAGVIAACRATNTKLTDQRALLVGAGAAGVGIARHLRHTMAVAGGEPSNVALWDTRGLVIDDRPDLDDFKAEMAWSASSPALPSREGRNDLARFVAEYRPTAIIGTTGQQGLFDEQLMTTMAGSVERPLVMAMSNPTSNCEAIPSDIVDWTDGRALIATGSPFGPVDHEGRSIPISQCNNVYVFPGVGLGAIVTGAAEVTDTMFAAAADTLAALTTDDDLEAGKLYPPVGELRSVSRRIAVAVAAAAGDGGVGKPLSDSDLADELDRVVWDLEYPELIPT